MDTAHLLTMLLARPDAHEWGGPWHWWPLMGLLWVALIAGAVWLVVRSRRGGDRAREILAERFARGELTGDEYRERLHELTTR